MDNPVPFDKAGRSKARSPSRERERSGRGRDILEVAVCYGLVICALWVPRGPDRWFDWATLVWVIATTALRFPGWRAVGMGWRGLFGSLWLVAAAVGVMAAGFAIAGKYHTLQGSTAPAAVFHRYWMYAIWALIQEFLLVNFFLLRLCRLLPSRAAAVWSAAGLFAFCHVPNPVLVPLVLIWGAIACSVFLRYRNLYTLGLAHAILGICVAMSIPAGTDHHMRVGYGYLTYRPHHRNVNDSATHHTFGG